MTITDSLLAWLFWLSAAGVVYAYLFYPALIFGLSRLFGREPQAPAISDHALPRVSLLIAAHNEAAVIESRILNALAMDYPPDRLEIVVASDGSDDGTAEICHRYQDRIRVLNFPVRQGKPATLNAAIPTLASDIIVLSDANTFMQPGALRLLARWFTDPNVGAVCGRLVLNDPRTGRNVDSVYWRYETFLKKCENRLGGLLGANGAIYAIRKDLFTPLVAGTVVDDFVIPLVAKLRSGCRILYDAAAVATEESAPNLRGEFHRRSRIGVGGFQALTTLWPLLSPRHGWTAFTFWSHKVLRWLCPLLMIAMLVAASALVGYRLYQAALLAQATFYTLCVVAIALPPGNRFCRTARILPMFTGMNVALLVGLFRWIRGKHTGIWKTTARAQPSGALP